MNIVVLDAGTLGDDLELNSLSEFGTVTSYPCTAPAELKDRIVNADIIVVNKVKIGAEALNAAKSLKLICVAATGYDNIDVAACREKGVGVCNVAGYSTDSVAQITAATVTTTLYSNTGRKCAVKFSRLPLKSAFSNSTA